MMNFAFEKVFKDLMTIHKPVAEDGGGKHVEVDDTLLFTAGFSCRSRSSLNKNRSSFSKCIAAHSGTTGGTFWGIANYLSTALPILILLENVATLGKENIAQVMQTLQSMGYAMVHFTVNAYGMSLLSCK